MNTTRAYSTAYIQSVIINSRTVMVKYQRTQLQPGIGMFRWRMATAIRRICKQFNIQEGRGGLIKPEVGPFEHVKNETTWKRSSDQSVTIADHANMQSRAV